MNTHLFYLNEPKLLFGYNQGMEDPRDGLVLYGPFEPLAPYALQAGVIGTPRGIGLYKEFVATIQCPLHSEKHARPTFPGFEAVFGIQWPTTPTIQKAVDEALLEHLLAIPSLKERTYKVVSLFVDSIKRIQDEEDTRIDIWFVVIPQRVWLRCRPKSEDQSAPEVSRTTLKSYQAGQRMLFADMEEEYRQISEVMDATSDFHDQLKARLLRERISIPVQIVLEPTLEFRDKYRNWDYKPEMRAHLAWTTSSAVYYKLGKLPWKLQGIRRGVCYLGLVFKKFERATTTGYACSAAQMFLDSGDGTVFRGNIGPWQSKNSKEYHLDQRSAQELLAKALDSYRGRMGGYPSEVFIHGRAAFASEEWGGFCDAVRNTRAKTELVGVVIKDSEKLKLFRDIHGEICKYGILRGLAYAVDDRDAYLWTRGFVPRLNTSISKEIPNPLRVQISRGKADIHQVLKDILALTKLNYNACLYGDGLPVTLRFSDDVGSILTAIDRIDVEVLPFKYYI